MGFNATLLVAFKYVAKQPLSFFPLLIRFRNFLLINPFWIEDVFRSSRCSSPDSSHFCFTFLFFQKRKKQRQSEKIERGGSSFFSANKLHNSYETRNVDGGGGRKGRWTQLKVKFLKKPSNYLKQIFFLPRIWTLQSLQRSCFINFISFVNVLVRVTVIPLYFLYLPLKTINNFKFEESHPFRGKQNTKLLKVAKLLHTKWPS